MNKGKKKELEIELEIYYVAYPPEQEIAWREGVRMLLDILLNDKQEIEPMDAVHGEESKA